MATATTRFTALKALLLITAVAIQVTNQQQQLTGYLRLKGIVASCPGFSQNITQKNTSGNQHLKYGLARYVYDTATGILSLRVIFSRGSYLFSPYAVLSADNINTTYSETLPVVGGTVYPKVGDLRFNYYYKFSPAKHLIPGANNKRNGTYFSLGDFANFSKVTDFATHGINFETGNAGYFFGVKMSQEEGTTTVLDITDRFNSALKITWVNVVFLTAAIVLIGLLYTREAFKIPFYAITLFAIGNFPLLLAAYIRGGIINPNDGYWQLWLWLGPSLGVLVKVGLSYKTILTEKRHPLVVYVALGYVAALILSFLFWVQLVPFILVAIPVTLMFEGIFHKKGLVSILLANGLIVSQLMVYLYIYYYQWNSALIPVRDIVNLILLVVCYIGAYGGCFGLYFFFRAKENEDPEGEAIAKNEEEENEAEDGGDYAKALEGGEDVGVDPTVDSEDFGTIQGDTSTQGDGI